MKDVVGNEICVNDTVALARRSGNFAELVLRKVIDLEDEVHRKSVKVEAPSGRSGWTRPSNLIVIKD